MGGFVRGKIECIMTNKNQNYNLQNVFKNLYDFFTSHPQYTLIALNYGNTNGPANTGAGTGTGYVDTTNDNLSPAAATFGNNAFFVVRQNASAARTYDVYHLFQWTGATNFTRGQAFGTSPAGSPGFTNGITNPFGNNNTGCVSHQCAIGVSGSGGTSGSVGSGFGNPWKGGQNALTGTLGIDIKPTVGPVWGAPAGGGTGVMIFPRSNDGDTGAFRASSTAGHQAENCSGILGGSNTNNDYRFHVIADDDSWIVVEYNQDIQASDMALAYAGIYTPRNGLPSGSQGSITPYVVIANAGSALPLSTANAAIYGDIAGTSNLQGGIIGNTTASVRPVIMDAYGAFPTDFNYNPNMQLSASNAAGGAFFDEWQIPVGIFETSPANISGYLGEIDFIRTVYNIQAPAVRWDFNRSFIGNSTVQQVKYSIPWDSQNRTVPRSGNSRTGITFIRPGPA